MDSAVNSEISPQCVKVSAVYVTFAHLMGS